MPEPPRRPRFQIHLSTAIVLMFVAGGLIGANFMERVDESDVHGFLFTIRTRGFPCYAIIRRHYRGDSGEYVYWGNVIIDIAVGLSIILLTWFLCEWLIRWRAARKGA